MTKRVLTLLAAGAIAAPALAATPISFDRDGVSYVAEVVEKDGGQLIQGHEVQTGRTFTLRVQDGRVTGDYDGTPVSYKTPLSSAKPIRTASR